jgi:DNA-binding transcriptional regulator YdaS (Cro superfamily)
MATSLTPPERQALAAQLGMNEQYLYQCLAGHREMGAKEAVRVERESGGRLTRRDVCTKSWRDMWPELDAAFPVPPVKRVRKSA